MVRGTVSVLSSKTLSRSRVCGCLIAFMVLVLPQARAGGAPPAPPPLAGYHVIYNVGGDHRFHLIRGSLRPGAQIRATPGGAFFFSPPQTVTLPAPLEQLAEPSGTVGAQPLLLVAGAPPNAQNVPSPSLGIEVTSQAFTTHGIGPAPNLPSIMGSGFGGLSLVQVEGATSSVGVNSPFLTMCAQQNGSAMGGGSGAACWNWQVQGGNGSDGPDILKLTRTPTTNATTNITVLFPAAINLATAPNAGMTLAGQITVGPMPVTFANANVQSTFTGAATGSGASGAAAGPVTVVPGQLTAAPPDASAVEGALQILQSYKTTGTTTAGLLACPTTTAQTASACSSVGQAENWVGVFNNIPGQLTNGSITAIPLRYGRVPISSVPGTNVQYKSGDFVCKDDLNAGYVIDNNPSGSANTPCPLGESIGIAVGDAGSGTSHLVDLVPEASVSGAVSQGLVLQFTCFGSAPSGNTVYLNGQGCVTTTNTVEFSLPFQSGTYTLKNMYVNYGTVGVPNDTVTLWVAGSSTNISCAPTSASPKQRTDLLSVTGHSASITAGQSYSIRVSTHGSETLTNVLVTIQLQ
jgi:hypothetical protein